MAAACTAVHAAEYIAEASGTKSAAAYSPPLGIPIPTFGINVKGMGNIVGDPALDVNLAASRVGTVD